MTPNCLIVLLDINRGFSASRHLGTLPYDLDHLRRLGLIDAESRMTKEGRRVVDELCNLSLKLLHSKAELMTRAVKQKTSIIHECLERVKEIDAEIKWMEENL